VIGTSTLTYQLAPKVARPAERGGMRTSLLDGLGVDVLHTTVRGLYRPARGCLSLKSFRDQTGDPAEGEKD